MAVTTVTIKPDTIVMIHGLWMTPRSWERWQERYEAEGTRCTRLHGPGSRSRSNR